MDRQNDIYCACVTPWMCAFTARPGGIVCNIPSTPLGTSGSPNRKALKPVKTHKALAISDRGD